MLDSRYPFLVSLDSSGLCSRLRGEAQGIARRTGTRVCYSKLRRQLFFYYSTPESGVLSLPAYRASGSEAVLEVDDAVRYIQMGKAPIAVKQAIADRREQEQKYEKQRALDAQFEESRPDAEDYADFLHRERCGVRKLISA